MKRRILTVSIRQSPTLRNSARRRLGRRNLKGPDQPAETQSDRLYNLSKCDIRAADYALKSAALLVVAGALSTGSYTVLKTADNIWEVLHPLAGFVGTIALLFVAFQLMCSFALSFDRAGRLRGTSVLIWGPVALFIVGVIGQLAPLFFRIWAAGL